MFVFKLFFIRTKTNIYRQHGPHQHKQQQQHSAIATTSMMHHSNCNSHNSNTTNTSNTITSNNNNNSNRAPLAMSAPPWTPPSPRAPADSQLARTFAPNASASLRKCLRLDITILWKEYRVLAWTNGVIYDGIPRCRDLAEIYRRRNSFKISPYWTDLIPSLLCVCV